MKRGGRVWQRMLLLALSAALLHALIPPNFMPVVSHGQLEMAFCPGMASDAMPSMQDPGLDHGHGSGPDASDHHVPCPFAAAAAAALPAGLINAAPAPRQMPYAVASATITAARGGASLTRNRGPPTLA
ncbi:DUF2946 family protein [Solimonas marina]|uniref:DUF2946 domain-containing protein n=1 Tax=Solimonas marina TaxID=2714601 RepID=A0A969WEB5_9GAMM|nr:DUF2946 family protein [Solimonas marina]NKF24453.1 hypothetical protein [Solimonas marina]